MTVVARQEYVRLAQLDRAFGYGPKGREFESSNAHKTRVNIRLRGFFCWEIVLQLPFPENPDENAAE